MNTLRFYLKKFLSIWILRPGQNIVDATLGGGGYTAAILEKVKPDGKVLAMDLDKDAIENFKSTNRDSNNTNADNYRTRQFCAILIISSVIINFRRRWNCGGSGIVIV